MISRVRHKKCDETRPACLQCKSTGRKCDFTAIVHTPRRIPNSAEPAVAVDGLVRLRPRLPSNSPNATSFEAGHFDYFRHVCSGEFAIFFQNDVWNDLVLKAAHTEPGIYHAAIAISALSRQFY